MCFVAFFYKLFVTKVRGQEVWPDQCGDKNSAHVRKFFNNSRCVSSKTEKNSLLKEYIFYPFNQQTPTLLNMVIRSIKRY